MSVTDPAGGSCYGLHLLGPLADDARARGLIAEPIDEPDDVLGTVTVGTWPEPCPETPHFGADSVCLDLLTGGHLTVDRASAVARIHRDRALTGHELAHPIASGMAIAVHAWAGRLAFHAGAVVIDGAAWIVSGAKEAGKSTLSAWLAHAGWTVLADDLVVLTGGRVLRGPRCVDLRPGSVAAFGNPEVLLPVRNGDRQRLVLGDAPPSAPVGGWVHLGVGPAPSASVVPPGERPGRVLAARSYRSEVADPAEYLDVLALPTLEFVRPLDFAAMDESIDVLLRAVRELRPA